MYKSVNWNGCFLSDNGKTVLAAMKKMENGSSSAKKVLEQNF